MATTGGDLNTIFSQVLSSLGPGSVQSQTAPATPQAGLPMNMNALFGQVLRTLAPTNAPATQSSVHPGPPSDIAGIFSQLLAPPAGASQRQPGASSAPPATQFEPQAVENTANIEEENLQEMINTLTLALSMASAQGQGSIATGPVPLSTLFASIGSQPDDGTDAFLKLICTHCKVIDSALGDLLGRVLQQLTVDDLLALLRGDWSKVAPLRESVGDFLIRGLGLGGASQAQLAAVANQIVDTLALSLDEDNLPQVVSHRPSYCCCSLAFQRIKERKAEDHNMTHEALIAVRIHTAKLLRFVLDDAANGTSEESTLKFASGVREWAKTFAGDLVSRLAQGMRAGLEDVSEFLVWFLETVRSRPFSFYTRLTNPSDCRFCRRSCEG
jgi:hypothetical protein